MKKKKDDTVVKTSVAEAIIVIIVCLVAFFGLVYIKLVPYIGVHISEQQQTVKKDAETEDLFSDEGVIYLDEEGNVIEDDPVAADETDADGNNAANEDGALKHTGETNTGETDSTSESDDTGAEKKDTES